MNPRRRRREEVERQGHQSIAVLRDPGAQTPDLALVHQQAAGTKRILVEDIALFIRADAKTADEHLPVRHGAEGVLQVRAPLPDGFDLRAGQSDPSFISVFHEIVVVGFFIGCDRPLFRRSHFRASFPQSAFQYTMPVKWASPGLHRPKAINPW